MISKEEFLDKIRNYLILNKLDKKWVLFSSRVQAGRTCFYSICLFVLIGICFILKKTYTPSRSINLNDTQNNLLLFLGFLFVIFPIIAFFIFKKEQLTEEAKITSFIFNLFGFTTQKECISKAILIKSGLFENYPFLREDDSFSGQFLNTKFSISEYNLSAMGLDVKKNAFKNRVYIKLDLKKRYLAHTQVISKKTSFVNYSTRVNLEDVDFIKEFDVFSTDQIEARTILTPVFIEKLKQLKLVFGGKSIDVAFFDNIVLFAINTPDDVFQAFPYKKLFLDLSFYERFYDEVRSIYDMIEILQIMI